MKLLIDPAKQGARLRAIERGEVDSGGGGGGEASLPSETRWWDAASVGEMEQAFRNLEEFLEAQVPSL
jgi:hypothetical protein